MIKTIITAITAATIIGTAAHAEPQPTEQTALRSISFDHMSINVADFDAAMDWYTEKLGFEITVSPSER